MSERIPGELEAARQELATVCAELERTRRALEVERRSVDEATTTLGRWRRRALARRRPLQERDVELAKQQLRIGDLELRVRLLESVVGFRRVTPVAR